MIALLAIVALAQTPEGPPNVVPKAPLPPVVPWGEPAPIPGTALVRGRVLELGSGLPVSGTVSSGGVAATIGPDGRFALMLPPGTHELLIENDEHMPFTASETVAADEVVDVVYRVERYTWDEQIVVYGEQTREEVSRTVISGDELRLIPGAFGDPVRALQSLPGVARPSTLEGAIVVRGAEAVNTRFYIDEVPVPYLFHFFLGRSVINPALVDDIEFFPGGMPSRFGDVTQAVVNVRTLDTKPKPGWHGRVSADLLDLAISGEGRISDSLSWQGGYRVSWVGGVIGTSARVYSLIHGLSGYRPAYPTLSYEDHMGRLIWRRGVDSVTLTWIGARDALLLHPERFDTDGDGKVEDAFEIPEGLPYDPLRFMDSGFHRVQLRWDRDTGEREMTTWISAGPERELSLLQGIGQLGDGIEFGRLDAVQIAARHRERIPLGPHGVLVGGADLDLEPVKVEDWFDLQSDGSFPVTKDFRARLSPWAEVQRTFGTTWVAPGLRATIQSYNDETRPELEPRITIRKEVADHYTATGFIGRFAQIPPADRYANGLGNPAIGTMHAWQASIGLEGRFPSGIDIDATIYGTRQDDLVVKDLQVEIRPNLPVGDNTEIDSASAHVVPTYRAVSGWAYGIEGMVRVRPRDKWFGWVALTLGKAIRIDPETGKTFNADYDLPVSFVAVAATELPYAFRLSGRVRATSGYPYTPQYAVYSPTRDNYIGLQGEENSERFSWFKQIDVRIDRTWTAKRARWTLYADVFNALNNKNDFLVTYDPLYREFRSIIWIPIIPTIGLEVSY